MRLKELDIVLDNYDRLDQSDLEMLKTWDLPEPHENREINFPFVELIMLMGSLKSIIDKHGIK